LIWALKSGNPSEAGLPYGFFKAKSANFVLFDASEIFGPFGYFRPFGNYDNITKLFCELWFSCFGLFQICGFGLYENAFGRI
jgi:hypothetical protein